MSSCGADRGAQGQTLTFSLVGKGVIKCWKGEAVRYTENKGKRLMNESEGSFDKPLQKLLTVKATFQCGVAWLCFYPPQTEGNAQKNLEWGYIQFSLSARVGWCMERKGLLKAVYKMLVFCLMKAEVLLSSVVYFTHDPGGCEWHIIF